MDNHENHEDCERQQTYKKFLKDYEDKHEMLLKKADKLRHNINKKEAEIWINAQYTQRRQNACRKLIENTHYITFNELYQKIKLNVISIYAKLDHTKKIYMCVGDDKRSSYFISIMAMYYIKQLKYKEPVCINWMDYGIGEQIIMFDDCSLSGAQFFNTIQDVGSFSLWLEGDDYVLTSTNIHFGVCVCTDYALKFIKERILKWQTQNKHVFMYVSTIYNSLEHHKKDFYDMVYYFTPYTYGHTKISIYFDHKLPDSVSTFMKTLNYAPILPPKLDYDEELLRKSLVFKKTSYGIISGIMTEEDFNSYYKEMLYEEMNIQWCFQEINKISRCIPYIPNYTIQHQQFIDQIKNMSYHIFNLNKSIITFYDENTDEESILEKYKEFENIISQLDDSNNRHPISFYKKIM